MVCWLQTGVGRWARLLTYGDRDGVEHTSHCDPDVISNRELQTLLQTVELMRQYALGASD